MSQFAAVRRKTWRRCARQHPRIARVALVQDRVDLLAFPLTPGGLAATSMDSGESVPRNLIEGDQKRSHEGSDGYQEAIKGGGAQATGPRFRASSMMRKMAHAVKVDPQPSLVGGQIISLKEFPETVRNSLSVFDADGDGMINSAELANAASMYVKKQRQATRLKWGLGLMVAFLALLIASNFITSIVAIEASKETAVSSSGIMTIKGSNNPVEVAESLTPTALTSYLPDSAFEQLRYFTATSPTGAKVQLRVEAFMRLPAAQCLPPIVKLVTPVGSIHIEGSNLEFAAQDTSPFFLEAGFLTNQAGPTRRRLTASSLVGFFNTLRNVEAAAANTTTCLPTLPVLPWRYDSMSKVTRVRYRTSPSAASFASNAKFPFYINCVRRRRSTAAQSARQQTASLSRTWSERR